MAFNGMEEIDFNEIMKFGSNNYILLSTSLDMYANREIPKKRIVMATLFRLCSLITGIRYAMSAAVNTDWMSMVMSDANHRLTNQRLLSSDFSLCGFGIFIMGVVVQYHEMNYKFTLIDFFIKWQNKSLIPLSVRNTRKLTVIVNTMIKLLMKQAFWPLVIMMNTLMTYPIIRTMMPNDLCRQLLFMIRWPFRPRK